MNVHFPPRTPIAMKHRPLPKPVTPIVTPRFRKLLLESGAYICARQEELADRYGVGSYQRYDWDQDEGTIVFSTDGVPHLVATFHFVGSVATKAKTWLWSWANCSLSCKVSDRLREVKAYGERHHLAPLTEPYWSADEMNGSEMTAISAYLLKAQGAYRVAFDHGFLYMILTDIRNPP
ncbi:MAG: DUF6882 domain-containing protein [Candidatus Polarisedimenticolia bacterium]